MNTFGNNLKKIRKEKGYTQEALAKIMGVSHVYINTYENDKRKPKIETVLKFANALGVPASDLISKDIIELDSQIDVDNSLKLAKEFGVKEVTFNEQKYINDKLLEPFNKLNYTGKQKVIDYATDLTTIPKYKK